MIKGDSMMKRYARVFICFVLLAALGVSMLPAAYAIPSKLTLLKCTVAGGRVRTAPGSANPVVDSLSKGEIVLYAGYKKGSHYCVCTDKGKIGYVYSGFMSYYGSVRADQIYYSSRPVKYYNSATRNARRKGTFRSYELIIVYQIVGGVGYAKNLKGKGGFISMSGMHKKHW